MKVADAWVTRAKRATDKKRPAALSVLRDLCAEATTLAAGVAPLLRQIAERCAATTVWELETRALLRSTAGGHEADAEAEVETNTTASAAADTTSRGRSSSRSSPAAGERAAPRGARCCTVDNIRDAIATKDALKVVVDVEGEKWIDDEVVNVQRWLRTTEFVVDAVQQQAHEKETAAAAVDVAVAENQAVQRVEATANASAGGVCADEHDGANAVAAATGDADNCSYFLFMKYQILQIRRTLWHRSRYANALDVR